MINQAQLLLNLLQLASPVLPVGAYSYSDGLETLVEQGTIADDHNLEYWLARELTGGAIRVETAVMLRGYQAFLEKDLTKISYWNNWLTASKETSELRQQSWQMGNSLLRLLVQLEESNCEKYEKSALINLGDVASEIAQPCNYAIAFGIGSANWQIEVQASVLAYLHSWAANLINVGIKLIPLGQTTGQQILFKLQNKIVLAMEEILDLDDDSLMACSWGLGLASMNHETQYTRLFRS